MGLKYYKLCFETMTQGMFAMTPCAVVCDLAHVWKPQFLDCRTAHRLGISKMTINWNVSLYNCVCVREFKFCPLTGGSAAGQRKGEQEKTSYRSFCVGTAEIQTPTLTHHVWN